ncbi:ammonium transporter [Brochothrix thermosphacta]|uniref:ammonium transporter n=1 Tax=Brochothrix thermosphacta TaxID=2756 RepID=UPI000D7A1ABF|nr:ammonium transporter [Brochothrix thermosphacta]SPP27174.1 ammonium transporter [Brochothrix thermosphacta]
MADTGFVFICALLVWLMTPGLAFFYGGMGQTKNVLSTAMYSFSAIVVVSILWVIVGYSLAFSPGNLFFGGFDYVWLKDVGYSIPKEGIPDVLNMMFQLTFCAVTVAIISGAVAERMNFTAWLLFISLWVLLVYTFVAHWVWGGGFINEKIGALDFAGGTVVHIASGVAGLVLALMLGKRKEIALPHNLTLVGLGATLVWLGWYGFNTGSALGLTDIAMHAFVNTNTAAVFGIVAWVGIEWIVIKKPTFLGTMSGALAGLVGITPAAGFVTITGAMCIGLLTAAGCYWAIAYLKPRLGYDDALDAFGLHGIGGTIGALLTGVFATSSVGGTDGLFSGNPMLVWDQFLAVIITIAFVAVMTYLIAKVVSFITPLRVNQKAEQTGLDVTIHGERAYRE